MSFNRGFSCSSCGIIPKAVKKGQRVVCPVCSLTVTPWEKPLKERSGRCRTCAGAKFESKIHNHQLLRRCRNCNEVYNIDTEKVVRKGVIEDDRFTETI